MKKRIIIAATFAACLVLCAAVWSQSEPAEEIPAALTQTAVTTTQPEVPEIPEIEEIIMPEEEKADAAQSEPVEETVTAREPSSIQIPPSSEVQALSEQNVTPPQEPEPTPTSSDSAPDNMVYVPGFGWIESQGPNHCDYAEDMYENGNKIGIMG